MSRVPSVVIWRGMGQLLCGWREGVGVRARMRESAQTAVPIATAVGWCGGEEKCAVPVSQAIDEQRETVTKGSSVSAVEADEQSSAVQCSAGWCGVVWWSQRPTLG